MATRQEIKETFVSELRAAVSGTVPSNDVRLYENELPEAIPSIVYTEDITPVSVNAASASPERVDRDGSGNVTQEVWYEYLEAQFTVYIRASDELQLEQLYEAVHTAFHKYSLGGWDKKDFHPDTFSYGVRVEDVTPADDNSTENTIRGDIILVSVLFYREYSRTDDNIAQINRDQDGELSTTS